MLALHRLGEWLLAHREYFLATLLAAFAAYAVNEAVNRLFLRKMSDLERRHKIRRTMTWITILLFCATLLLIWSDGIGELGVFLGILGAGLALSLQETLLCLAAWILIIAKHVFDLGDRIEIDGRIGDVIDVGVFQTTLLEVGGWVKGEQSTGRIIVIANSEALRHPVVNYTKGFPFIWSEFSLVVTYESDWKAAKAILLEQAEAEAKSISAEVNRQIREMQRQYAIHYSYLTPTVYTAIVNQGIELTLRFLSPVRQRREMAHRLSENILDALLTHPKIDFAYPTSRIVRNTEEGKDALKPSEFSQSARGLA